ncbi:MAG: hypothetical protein JXR91_09810 [Deltaproteobacteria bacterium]|nr:hypothetical protein [Deltaproteobacteria bacterium]
MKFFILLPVISLFFSTAAGVAAGLLFPNAILSSILFFLIYAGTLFFSIYKIYTTPGVFTYGHFIGYFPGAFYDTHITVNKSLVLFRVHSLVIIALIYTLIKLFLDTTTLTLSFNKKVFKLKYLTILSILGAIIYLFNFNSENLGFTTSHSKLQEILPKKVSNSRLNIYFDKSFTSDEIESYTEDLFFSLYTIEEALNIKSKEKYSIYVFKNSTQKKAATGAGVALTKPWLKEAYIQKSELPDFTGRHELAHLILGTIAKGPLKLAGNLNGYLPNPALIEGAATALGGSSSFMDLHHQAKAMKDLNLLPDINSISGLGFFKQFAPTAYTASGSFYLFILERFGPSAFKNIYKGESVKKATGFDLARLKTEWFKMLDNQIMSQNEMAAASYKFNRPSIIAQTCIHHKTEINIKSERLLSEGNCKESLKLLNENCGQGKCSINQKLKILDAYVKCGDTDNTISIANNILKSDKQTMITQYVLELVLDLKNLPDFKKSSDYLTLYKDSPDSSSRRRLYIKYYLSLKNDKDVPYIIEALKLGNNDKDTNPSLTAIHINSFYLNNKDDSLAAYLAARQFINFKDYKTGTDILSEAFINSLETEPQSIVTEACFMMGKAYYMQKKYKQAKIWFDKIKNDKTGLSGTKFLASDWSKRADWKQ